MERGRRLCIAVGAALVAGAVFGFAAAKINGMLDSDIRPAIIAATPFVAALGAGLIAWGLTGKPAKSV